MAQKVHVVLVDDLDGGPADETVSFALDGHTYEIDLSEANAARLREAMATYVGAARRAGSRPATRRGAGQRRPAARGEAAEIRAWARSEGIAVSERGRIAADVVARYEAAHAQLFCAARPDRGAAPARQTPLGEWLARGGNTWGPGS